MKKIYLDANGEVSTKKKLVMKVRKEENEIKVMPFYATPLLAETIKIKEVHIEEEPVILVDPVLVKEKTEESIEVSDNKPKKKSSK